MLSINNKIITDDEATISPLADSYMYGYGVFETLRTYNGRIFGLEEHIKRLFHSAELLKIQHKNAIDDIEMQTQQLFKESQQDEARIKIVLTSTELIIWVQELKLRPKEWYETGITVVTYEAERYLPEAKHMNCLPSHMGQLYAKEKNVYEALLIDNNGIVREGCYSNVFWIKDNILFTTKTKVLKGITAETAIEAAQGIIDVDYKDATLEEILEADEGFITNTTSEILPVVKIGEKIIGEGKVGKYTSQLIQNFSKQVDANTTDF